MNEWNVLPRKQSALHKDGGITQVRRRQRPKFAVQTSRQTADWDKGSLYTVDLCAQNPHTKAIGPFIHQS